MTSATIHVGDALAVMRGLEAESAHCCVTSPPYWGLRDYGVDGQLGQEATPEEYVARLVEVLRAVRRVLREDGTLWLNLGDSYAGNPGGWQGKDGQRASRAFTARIYTPKAGPGLKPKDLVGIPWRVAFALQADGWFLRSDIVWAKPNPMPESVTDRPTKSHEYVFLLSKSPRYFFDQEAVREPHTTPGAENNTGAWRPTLNGSEKNLALGRSDRTGAVANRPADYYGNVNGRNIRSVWTIPTTPFPGAHFAVMPAALAERCIKAGSASGGTVLDPFTGAGTTALVALRLGRSFVGAELNPEYAAMARARIRADAPLYNACTVLHQTPPVHPGVNLD